MVPHYPGMLVEQQTHQAIDRAVNFLLARQEPTGAFLASRCQDQAPTTCLPEPTPLATAVVLNGLLAVKHPAIRPALQRGLDYLAAQSDVHGWFRYYLSSSPLSLTELPNFTDTCFNSLVLRASHRHMVASPTPLLPYQTAEGWFPIHQLLPQEREAIAADASARAQFVQPYGVSPTVIDPLTNAFVLTRLAGDDIRAPELCRVVNQQARYAFEDLHSAFGDSPYLVMNTMARAYHAGATCLGEIKPVQVARLLALQRSDGSWGSTIETGWAAGALMMWGYRGASIDRGIAVLLRRQRKDGSWPRGVAWVISPKVWVGSDEVSTGIFLEVLGQYQQWRGTS